MYRILRFSAVLCFLLLSATASGQLGRIKHTVVTGHHALPTMGPDVWFALPAMADNSEQTATLYITADQLTNIHTDFGGGGLTRSIQVLPHRTATFNMPLSWLVQSSGKVEDMCVHLSSNDGPFACWLMMKGAKGEEGMYVLPTIGWRSEYVVAAAPADSVKTGDYPSQMMIVSKTDLTRVTITPSCALRVEATNGSNCSAIFASKGMTTSITLNRGQCIQFKSTCANDCSSFDLTGTIIKSNFPIGVIAGAQYTRIPCGWDTGNFVLDMIPPVRTWGQNYVTIPFYEPPGAALTKSRSRFLVVASQNGQKIYRFDAATQIENVECSLNKYDTYITDTIGEGSYWHSDAPFMLVQYIHSPQYPDGFPGVGAPAMVVLPPIQPSEKDEQFELPPLPAKSFVNVLGKANDKHIMLDRTDIRAKATRVAIDGKVMGYRLSNIPSGGHIVQSDSGIGVTIYDYDSVVGKAYAMPATMSTGTFNSPDTIPPQVNGVSYCSSGHVDLVDTLRGLSFTTPPTGIESGLWYYTLDSSANMAFTQNANWGDGVQQASASYDMFVLDEKQEAILIVSYYDQAGNITTITSTYKPVSAKLSPPLTDFGVGNATNCTIMYDTLRNTGVGTYNYNTLKLILGNVGFQIDTAYTNTKLQNGETRLIRICFKPMSGNTVFDTLLVDDGCNVQKVVLIGSGGAPDFYTSPGDFGTIKRGLKSIPQTVFVHNTSNTIPMTYDHMYVEDSVHFKPEWQDTDPQNKWVQGSNVPIVTNDPRAKPGDGTSDVPVKFIFQTTDADTDGFYTTTWCTHSSTNNTWRCNLLTAHVVSAAISMGSDETIAETCGDALVDIFLASISAAGTANSPVVKITHSDTTHFKLAAIRSNTTKIARLDTLSDVLTPGQSITLWDTVYFPVHAASVTYHDTIRAYTTDVAGVPTQVLGAPIVMTAEETCSLSVHEPTEPVQENAYLTTDISGAFLRAHIPEDWQEPVRIEIVNTLGANVLSATLSGNTIDVSRLASGVYFYRLSSERHTATGKIFTQR